jgi:hypothetical protein
MNAVRQRLFRSRHAAMIVLALVLAMQALIPQGMMAAPDAIRGVAVLLCDGTGVADRIDLPMSQNRGKAGHTEACPFSVLAQAWASAPAAVWDIAAILPEPDARPAIRIAMIPRAMRHSRPPPRAPPVTV